MEQNLFLMVMEAGGDLVQPFDAGGADMNMDASADTATPPDDASMGDPPPLADDSADGSMGFDMGDNGGGGDFGEDTMSGDDGMGIDDPSQNGTTNNDGTKLSEKANSILNQKLYHQMMERNQEIEDVVESINHIIPLLSYNTIKENDENMTRLKATLEKGKSYLISNFVDAKYGENLIFFQKLDALYTLLLEQLNTNLKKVKDENN